MASWERVLTEKNIERLLVGDLFTKGDPGGLLTSARIRWLMARMVPKVSSEATVHSTGTTPNTAMLAPQTTMQSTSVRACVRILPTQPLNSEAARAPAPGAA